MEDTNNVLINGLDLSSYINCLLVLNGERPAFFPEIEYESDNKKERDRYFKVVQRLFKTLSIVHVGRYKMVVKDIKDKKYYKNTPIGDILGYPCSGELGNMIKNNYGISMIHIYNGTKTQFFANACDTLDKKISYDDMFHKFSAIIYEDKYLKNKTDDIIMEVQKQYGSIHLLEKIMNSENFDIDEESSLLNMLWNYTDSNLNTYFNPEYANCIDDFYFNNKKCRSLLIAILTHIIKDEENEAVRLAEEYIETIKTIKTINKIK
jgi:hypothetical protein